MASIRKYRSHAVGRLFLHNNRSPNDGTEHSNEDIDNERTMYNYYLKKGNADALNERLQNVFVTRASERRTVLAEVVVTLPKDVKDGDEKIETGLKKFGAMLGDNVEVGCGSVLNPGTVIGRCCNIYPLSSVRGCVPANHIYKSKTEVVEKQ